MKKKFTKFTSILCILTLVVFVSIVPLSDDPGPHVYSISQSQT